jgi:hypothetical protein
VKHTAEARIAEIRLRESQGILAAGCCDVRPAIDHPPFVARAPSGAAPPAIADRRSSTTR